VTVSLASAEPSVRPLERADLSSIEAPSAALAASLERAGAPPSSWAARLDAPSGDTTHRFGVWRDGALSAVVEITPSPRARSRHLAALLLAAATPDDAAIALRAAVRLADDWLDVARVRCEPVANDTIADVLRAAGFVDEGTLPAHRALSGAREDVALLTRLRPGWSPARGGPPPEFPPPGPRVTPVLRPIEVADAEAFAALMRDERVVWGTQQLPSVSGDAWRARLERPWGQLWVATVGDALVGNVGVHPLPAPSAHVAMLGMSVHAAWQGRGIGRPLLDHALVVAANLGCARLLLEVFDDNERAIKLYEAFGFERCAVKKYDVFRNGGYASSLVMHRPL
jgi:putative acetyltransferase